MIFRFAPQVLEDAVLPETLHVIPVLNLTVTDRVVRLVGLAVGLGLLTNVEVKILNRVLVNLGGTDSSSDNVSL